MHQTSLLLLLVFCSSKSDGMGASANIGAKPDCQAAAHAAMTHSGKCNCQHAKNRRLYLFAPCNGNKLVPRAIQGHEESSMVIEKHRHPPRINSTLQNGSFI